MNINPLHQEVLRRMLQPTANPVDRQLQVASLHYARTRGLEAQWREMFLAARTEWLNTLTVWQRNWQCKTRRATRARFHDSVAIRERYVRCKP